MRSPTHYLKIDLGERDAFGKAQWLSSVHGATPFETNAESMGTGLSLAIAKAVIEAHGGKISIASVPDKGTTVDLRLPQPVED